MQGSREEYKMKEQVKDWVISLIGLTAGSILAAAALENFLIPLKILDGGLNGIGMIINFLTDLPLSVLIVVLNIPFFVVKHARGLSNG
mgnify:CR=1 FL=1